MRRVESCCKHGIIHGHGYDGNDYARDDDDKDEEEYDDDADDQDLEGDLVDMAWVEENHHRDDCDGAGAC